MNTEVFLGLTQTKRDAYVFHSSNRFKHDTLLTLLSCCCESLGIKISEAQGNLKGNKIKHSHKAELVEVRHLFYYLAKKNKIETLAAAKLLGQHRCISVHAVKNWKNRLKFDKRKNYPNITSTAESSFFRAIKKETYG